MLDRSEMKTLVELSGWPRKEAFQKVRRASEIMGITFEAGLVFCLEQTRTKKRLKKAVDAVDEGPYC